jgi:hypothetical protein
VIYNFSYWTAQIASSDKETWAIRLINRMGHDLETTGLAKAARSVVTMPDMYYKLADLAGLLRQNPQLGDRLGSYPAFLSLAERDDFRQLGQDNDFQNAWKNLAPIPQLLNNSRFRAMLNNDALTAMILNLVRTEWDDLGGYLKTGKSLKYDPINILGCWDFNLSVSFTMYRQARPNIQPNAMRAAREWMRSAYSDTTFIAGADGQVFLKNLPTLKTQPGRLPTTEKATWKGQWKDNGTNYDLSLSSNGQNKSMTAHTDGTRMTIKSGNDSWVFDRED